MRKSEEKERFFEEIYALYAQKLEHLCLKYVSYEGEYRDIVDESIQETFLQAVKSYDEIIDFSPTHLEAWIVKTCWNRFRPAVDKYRRRKKRHIALDNEMEQKLSIEQLQNILDAYFERLHNQQTLEKLLALLNSKERSVVTRRILQGASFQEIAAQSQTTVGAAVKAILARARAKTRKAVKEHPQDFS